MENVIPKIQHLLLHSVKETNFYDLATDQIITSELKSAFAKYLWLRSEHILGIRSFLISSDQALPQAGNLSLEQERFRRFFSEAVRRRDNFSILKAGMRLTRLTLHKYSDTIFALNGKDRLNNMLHNQLTEIRDFFNQFSSLKNNNLSKRYDII